MDTMEMLIIVTVGIIVLLVVMGLGVRIVPQGNKFVVQRLGKYHATLNPGLNLIIPFFDTVSYRLTTKDIVLDIPSQEVITEDNAVIETNAIAFINIVNPEKAVYGVDDYSFAIQNLVQTTLRSLIGEMSLDKALSSRDTIKTKLKNSISDDIADWGIVVKSVEIQDIKPSATMQASMEEQAAAERMRRAAVTRAEGEKQATILEAEGRLEASRRDAEAQVVLAEASATAITKITASIGEQEMPVLYLLGEKYITALENLAESANSKTMVLPADLLSAIKGMIGSRTAP